MLVVMVVLVAWWTSSPHIHSFGTELHTLVSFVCICAFTGVGGVYKICSDNAFGDEFGDSMILSVVGKEVCRFLVGGSVELEQ